MDKKQDRRSALGADVGATLWSCPQLTPGELKALRLAALQTHRTPRGERVERHPYGRQYARSLFEAGLLCMVKVQGRPETLELSLYGLEVLHAYWIGAMRSGPRNCPLTSVDEPPREG